MSETQLQQAQTTNWKFKAGRAGQQRLINEILAIGLILNNNRPEPQNSGWELFDYNYLRHTLFGWENNITASRYGLNKYPNMIKRFPNGTYWLNRYSADVQRAIRSKSFNGLLHSIPPEHFAAMNGLRKPHILFRPTPKNATAIKIDKVGRERKSWIETEAMLITIANDLDYVFTPKQFNILYSKHTNTKYCDVRLRDMHKSHPGHFKHESDGVWLNLHKKPPMTISVQAQDTALKPSLMHVLNNYTQDEINEFLTNSLTEYMQSRFPPKRLDKYKEGDKVYAIPLLSYVEIVESNSNTVRVSNGNGWRYLLNRDGEDEKGHIVCVPDPQSAIDLIKTKQSAEPTART